MEEEEVMASKEQQEGQEEGEEQQQEVGKAEEKREEEEEEEEEGVLLYYNFVSIPDMESLKQWFLSLCTPLSLVGRIRIAPDGINVTVGGTMASLYKHIEAVQTHPLLGSCDFKLASTRSSISSGSSIANEVGFDSLSVRLVKELVTLGVPPSNCPSIKDAGLHLSAVVFHTKLQEAEYLCDGSNERKSDQFISSTPNCEPLAGDRFSQHDEDKKVVVNPFTKVMQSNSREPKHVLLDVRNIYETRIGRFVPPEGVAFLDPKLRQYSDLPRWIDSNAEKLQDKNIFMYCTGGVRCEMASAYIKSKGKGFQSVFQLSGGIQRYLEAFPDGGYFKGKNFVFDHRLAVPSSSNEVVGSCMNCGIDFDDYSSRVRCSYCRMLVLVCKSCQPSIPGKQLYVCELCETNQNVKSDNNYDDPIESSVNEQLSTKVEITVARGITIKDVCESARVDGKKKLRILCLHGFRQSATSLKGRLASFTKKLKSIAEFIFVDAPHPVPLVFAKAHVPEITTKLNPMPKILSRKYAWLVTPEMISSSGSTEEAQTTVFDKDQYKNQTEGWMASLDRLQQVFSENGPFDGVLGFSQGAAMAFSLCLLRSSFLRQEFNIFRFRFVMLCSGFLSPAREHQEIMLAASLPLECPSLHVFGDEEGCDRQVRIEESKLLVSMFSPDTAMVLQHKSGHIVPCQKEYVNQVRSFLTRFIS